MTELNVKDVPDEMLVDWFNHLIGRVFKILPLSEKEPYALENYIGSLVFELSGSRSFIKKIRNDGYFLSLISVLYELLEGEHEHHVYKREVFKCISIIEKINDKYFTDKEEKTE